MANRLEQLNIAYKKALGTVLLKEFPQVLPLSVTDVLINPSTQSARVWLETTPETLRQVQAKRNEIQNAVNKLLSMRYTPKLTFMIDDHYLDHIDELFDELGEKKTDEN